jgi:hypothetical protein
MIEGVIEPKRRDLGGFEVGRVLPSQVRRMVGPFIFFDHIGPVDIAPGVSRSMDVRPHPHIGLATVTYLLEGEITHRDSLGIEQAIRPGEVNWMTAGRGITHSERFERLRREGGRMHALQSWVALPTEAEESEPGFVHYDTTSLPVAAADGARLRLIAGDAYGERIDGPALSPLFYVHCELDSGGRVPLPNEHPERAAYVVSGEVEVGGDRYETGRMLVFAPHAPAVLVARTPAVVMLLGGEPVGERFIEWNFVSSSRERIEQAKADWRAGRMKLPDLDNREFIPLPGDPPTAAANPLS